MNDEPYHQTKRIDDDMTLAAFNLLARVIARNPSIFGRFDTLAVDNACCRRGFLSFQLSRFHNEMVVDTQPKASRPPLVEVTELIRGRAPTVKRVVFETGPLSVRFYHALRAEDLPVICIDARHAKAALDMATNKTDSNDADGLAHLAKVVFFREVRVKGFDSMLARTRVAARTRLVHMTTELSNQIRGIMKRFGLVVPADKGSVFEKNVRNLLPSHDDLAHIVLPLLDAWKGLRARAAALGRQLVVDARQSQACRISMSIPGVGAITATSFATAIEERGNFSKSRSVGAWVGLTTRRYQSGEVDYNGHTAIRAGSCTKRPRSFLRAAPCRVHCEHGGFNCEKGSASKELPWLSRESWLSSCTPR